MKRRRWLAWTIYVVWSCMTVAAMLVPTDRVPKVFWHGMDKVAHTAMFALTGALGQAAAPWVTLFVSLPLAVGLELIQKQLPHRTYDQVELYANVIGVVVGVLCLEMGKRLGRK